MCVVWTRHWGEKAAIPWLPEPQDCLSLSQSGGGVKAVVAHELCLQIPMDPNRIHHFKAT